MNKLATILAATTFTVAGAAFAADHTGSPTVPPNSANPNDLSYGDKSGTAKGSNAPMNDDAAIRAEANAPKKHHKSKAKVHHDTTSGTTTGTIAPETGTVSEQELKAKADIGSGTTPAAPTPANRASTVNDTQGQSGR